MSSSVTNLNFFPPSTHPDSSHTDCIYTMALTSKHLITGSKDTTLRVWSLETQLPIHDAPLTSHTKAVLCLATFEQEGLVFSGSVDTSLCCWAIETGELVKRLDGAHTESILDVKVSADGKYIVTAGKDQCVKIWNRQTLGFIQHVGARQGEEEAATQSRLHNLAHEPPSPLAILSEGIAAAVNVVAVTPAYIISGCGDRTIKMWNASPPHNCIRTLRGHERGVATLVLSRDLDKIMSGSSDNTIRIWDVETGAQESCLRGHANLVRRICVVPNATSEGGGTGDECFVSGSYDEHVFLWVRSTDADDGWTVENKVHVKELGMAFEDLSRQVVGGNESRVFSVQSDGKKVFASGQSNFVVAWDLG